MAYSTKKPAKFIVQEDEVSYGRDVKRPCLNCPKLFTGRADKKFCSDACRVEYHNKLAIADEKEIKRVMNILKKNRKVLQTLLGDGKGNKKAKKDLLMRKGFSFDYVTQVEGNYRFCFEYGYCSTNNKDYFSIVRGFDSIVNRE